MQPSLFWLTSAHRKITDVAGNRLLQTLLALILFSFTTIPAQAAEQWPTTRFKVFAGNPFAGDVLIDHNIVEFENFFAPDPEAIEEIEKALSEAAQWYEDHNFPAPLLDPLVRTEEGLAYQVYLCNEEWDNTATAVLSNILQWAGEEVRWIPCVADAAGRYYKQCTGDPTRSKFIVVNSDKALNDSNELTGVAYQTLAHELMHAIISNTPFGRADRTCLATPHWIGEGIPDAISFDIVDEIWKGRFTPDNSDGSLIKQYGYRPYSVYLPEGRKSAGAPGFSIKFDFKYTTSSFWRYVADSHPEGWGVLLTKEGSSIPGLLDLTLSGNATNDNYQKNWRSEVRWLNKGLKKKYGSDLGQVYGAFVNNFAYRFPPMKNYRGRPEEEVLPKWVKNVFGNCETVDLSSQRSQAISVSVRKLAAACVWVEPIGTPGLVHVSFQTFSDDLDMLKGITVGMAGTMLVSRASPIGPAPWSPSLHLASWRDYPQDGSKRTLYIISNVAEDPGLSEDHHVVFDVSRPAFSNSAMATVPLPPGFVAKRPQKPSFRKHAKKLSAQKAATQKMVTEQMELDKNSLNPNVSSATSVRRKVKVPPCAEPFKYTPCGPRLQISLSLRPGTYIAPGGTNAAGGVAAQTFGGFIAMSQASPFEANAQMQELNAMVEGIDGSHVGISIPLIDYNQTGTFDNAQIRVKMSGDRTYSAFGPPDDRGRTRLTGRVTIDVFTPFAISGSFSAPLAEFLPSPGPGQPPIYKRLETVTGTFTSVAPWLSDERIQILPESNEKIADDIANTFGVPVEMINAMKEDGTIPGGSNSASGSGSSSGHTVGAPECTCECSMKPHADELCELLCEEEFAQCK